MKLFKKLMVLVLVLLAFVITGCVDDASSYRITFRTDGGTKIEQMDVIKGTIPTKPADPEKEGFEFGGWYTDAGLTEEYLFNEPITKNIVVYAKWIGCYTITFVTNCEVILEPVEVKEGELIESPQLTNEGLTLVGWYLDSEFENKYDFKQKVTSDLTLYAKWVDTSEVFTVTFVAGEGYEVESQNVVYSNTVVEPEELKSTAHKVTGWYTDKELTNKYDFDSLVYEDLTLYAKWEQYVYILSTSSNRNWVAYNNNIKEQTNKEIEYIDRTQAYMVGDDNGWKVLPIYELGVLNAAGDDFDDYTGVWHFTYKLYELTGEEYVEVLDDSALVDSFDKENGLIDFSEAAIGKSLKVEIIPEYLTVKQSASDQISKYVVTYYCGVVDGFNAYTALDLAYLDNRPADEEGYDAWVEFKTLNNLDVNYHPTNVILHTNIKVTKDDLPQKFFYNEGDADLLPSDSDYERTLGSLRDYVNLYQYNAVGNEFGLYGNYFNLDTSTVPVVTRAFDEITPEGMSIGHSVVLHFSGDDTGKVNVKNISLLGNAPKVENTQKAGGLILIQVQGPETLIKNTLSNSFFIAFMAEDTKAPMYLEDSKSYDSFNSFLYNWGSPTFVVKNCTFEGAGGPVLIQDHVRPGEEDESIAHTEFIDCTIDSYVAGSEGWFSVVNATALVPTIKALDQVLNAYGKTFLTTNEGDSSITYFNFVGIIKSGNAQSFTSEKVEGSIKIGDAEFNYGEGNPYLSGMLDQTFALGAPSFQGDTVEGMNGFAYFNGSALIGVDGNPILDPTNNLFTGDYISIYYNGMCIIFKLYDLKK
ncbi:MAG: InlB B-repeat-containing protein [Bacilli bacterium]|nr:InlB B-repeat-containing protein [Bacilli bacterium]